MADLMPLDECLPYALEVARQLHDLKKAAHIDDLLLRWDADTIPAPSRYYLQVCLDPFVAIAALRTNFTGVLIFLPRRRNKECPHHGIVCLPTRENEAHGLNARNEYDSMTAHGEEAFAPTLLVDLLDPWPREVDAPAQKRKTIQALPASLRYYIMQRDGFRCQLCGASPHHGDGTLLEVDHKQSRAHGGSDSPDNLLPLCKPCNIGKGLQDI